MKVFLKRFVSWLLVLVFLCVIASGAVVLVKARGSDAAVLKDPFWGLAKWFLLDLHVVFGIFLTLLALIHLGLRRLKAEETKPRASTGRRVLAQVLPMALALFVTYQLAQVVFDQHPVLIHDRHATAFPSSTEPDQVLLTWSGDPSTTQTVQWRTSPAVEKGVVRYREASARPWQTVDAEPLEMADPYLVNDPVCLRHTGVIEGLEPDTTYVYQVGDGTRWSDEASFKTAPSGSRPFTFLYMGDVQKGFEDWGNLRRAAEERHPAAAFCVLAGDLVNDGGFRGQWDAFFECAGDLFATCPLVPVPGNHDDDDWGSFALYTSLFALPEDGPEGIDPERAYSFEYGGVLFVTLDSNLRASTQTAWLEEQLARSKAQWKIVVFHHPAYASKAHRDNPDVRDEWVPLLEKHGVHLVLQGHDHAYMRTYPLLEGKRIDDPAKGVTYVVTVAGTKYYDQEKRDYMAVAETELSTYQVIDIDGRKLTYRAYNLAGEVVDEFTIVK